MISKILFDITRKNEGEEEEIVPDAEKNTVVCSAPKFQFSDPVGMDVLVCYDGSLPRRQREEQRFRAIVI